MAFRVWNYLSNGMGGIDWAGLPVVCAHLGVVDPSTLMEQLYVIKTHRPPKDAE